MYDVIVIGGGTAALTAAIYIRRAGRNVLVLEAENFGGQITSSPRIENYPAIAQISGMEFASNLLDQALALGMEIELERVLSVEDGQVKTVRTENKSYLCRSIILATGAKHRHLGIEREDEFFGKGVSYCAVCDGAFFKGKTAAVVGGGNTAVQSAAFLSAYCQKVYLIHRREGFRADESTLTSLRAKENVEFLLNWTVEKLEGQDALQGVVLHSTAGGITQPLSVDGLFIAIGQLPDNQNFADVVVLDENGYIQAGEDCITSASGIFAAGDCRTKAVRQLTTAAADGAVAALAACEYVQKQG